MMAVSRSMALGYVLASQPAALGMEDLTEQYTLNSVRQTARTLPVLSSCCAIGKLVRDLRKGKRMRFQDSEPLPLHRRIQEAVLNRTTRNGPVGERRSILSRVPKAVAVDRDECEKLKSEAEFMEKCKGLVDIYMWGGPPNSKWNPAKENKTGEEPSLCVELVSEDGSVTVFEQSEIPSVFPPKLDVPKELDSLELEEAAAEDAAAADKETSAGSSGELEDRQSVDEEENGDELPKL